MAGLSVMDHPLPIGDFARATHMSVKTLRYYHRVGLLEPAEIDRHTGYRRYTTTQIPTAQIIRRFRDLDMPVDEVAKVLAAPDIDARNELIAAHLSRLEDGLSRTQTAVSSLRDLLAPSNSAPPDIGRRRAPAAAAAAIREVVDVGDALSWYQGALGMSRPCARTDRPAASSLVTCSPTNEARQPSSCRASGLFVRWAESRRW
jgi:DNA-binding transcriptional MerR regulator